MNKNTLIAIVVCALITFACFVGSTGLFYAEFRPLRNRDLVAYLGAWIWLAYMIFSARKSEDQSDR